MEPMDKIYIPYIGPFFVTEEMEAWAKARRAARDKRYGNRYPLKPGKKDWRWIGDACERITYNWLTKRTSEKAIWIQDTPANNADIVFRDKTIDVKGKHNEWGPRPEYFVDITIDQIENNPSDYYFFCWYMMGSGNVYLLGGISHNDFMLNSTPIDKGDPLPNKNGTPAQEPARLLMLKYLTPTENFFEHLGVDNVLPTGQVYFQL